MSSTKVQFDRVAEEYDFVNSLLNDYTFFISNLSSSKGSALDIGCGSGILADELAKYYDKVVGIDISDEMLTIAKMKRLRSNTCFLNMNAERLNFDHKFDFIVSRTTFHHLNDIPSVINQMKDLLHEGGKIVIVDNVSEVETPAAHGYIIGAILEFIPQCFRFGIRNAVRIFRHSTSKHWLEHLAADKYLSEQKFHEIYGKLLPGCKFQRMGWAMGIVWEKKNPSTL